jgi:hypothetical protein
LPVRFGLAHVHVAEVGVTCEDEVVVCLRRPDKMMALELVWLTMTGDDGPTLLELRRLRVPTEWIYDLLPAVDLEPRAATLVHERLSMMPDRCLLLSVGLEEPWRMGAVWAIVWDDHHGARVVDGERLRFMSGSTAFFPFEFVPLADGRLLASSPAWYPPQIHVILT